MKSIFRMRGRRFAVAAVAIFVVAGGVAWAAIGDGGVIQGCYKKNNGQLRVVSSAAACDSSEVAISWNQKGQQGDPGAPGTNGTNGADGVSPTVTQLDVGNVHCPTGGAAITDAANTTAYVCNGQNGQDGTNGQPFSGTFTSGDYSISVTDTGITLQRAGGPSIKLIGDAINVRSGTGRWDTGTDLTLMAGTNVSMRSGLNTDIRAGLNADIRGLTTDIRGDVTTDIQSGANTSIQAGGLFSLTGALVNINTGSTCHPAARAGDSVNVTTAPGLASILTGEPTVCIGG